jgi:hypothetical protein
VLHGVRSMPLAEVGFGYAAIPEGERATRLVEFGPTIQAIVGHLDTKGTGVSLDAAQANEQVLALIDTGALMSCIDDVLAKKLALPVIDQQQCSGVSGTSNHDVYMAYIDIPNIGFGQYGRFLGVHLESGGQHHKVLFGRTLLQTMVMIYDGLRGHVTLAR